jgi:2-polyprenyl-3-methyl-5-hydroxy-6-metoxy-1,4-benzoquinol methylase
MIVNKNAKNIHGNVPANWYNESVKADILQRIWHESRFKEIKNVIETSKGKILDIGCADGTFSKVIFDASKAKEIIGIDVLKRSIDWAEKYHKEFSKMHFKLGDAHDLKYMSETFDAVFALEVLEHVLYPDKVVNEVKRVLKKHGYAVFLVPSDNLLFRITWFLWLKFYPRGWVWKDTHIQTFRKDKLVKICKDVGFTIEINKKFNLGMLHLVKVRK